MFGQSYKTTKAAQKWKKLAQKLQNIGFEKVILGSTNQWIWMMFRNFSFNKIRAK